jgi:lipopolysaccharide export system permease protein
MSLLDRYLFRNFAEPFLLALGAFLGVWLIFDLSAHGADFFKNGAALAQVCTFYLLQLPQVLLLALPISILLALLFCCSRMSRSNEIISMLSSGRSLGRVLLPLFLVGAAMSGLCLWFAVPTNEAHPLTRLRGTFSGTASAEEPGSCAACARAAR